MGVTTNNNRICISVKDTGIGIKEEDKQLLFQMFSQIGAVYQGVGLGLWITKKIVDALEGQVQVFSSGKGSEFRVTLPMKILSKQPKRKCEVQIFKLK